MRGEVDDKPEPARTRPARGFDNGARTVVEEMQHLMNQHRVKRVVRQSKIVDVALPHAAMAQPGADEPRAGESKHIDGEVEAKSPFDLRSEQLQHAACAGAEVEQAADGRLHKRTGNR